MEDEIVACGVCGEIKSRSSFRYSGCSGCCDDCTAYYSALNIPDHIKCGVCECYCDQRILKGRK